MIQQKTQHFWSRDFPNRTFIYTVPTSADLKDYPCCWDATVTTGLIRLIDDDEIFAFLKLKEGLKKRRRSLLEKRLPIGHYTIEELLRAGYLLDTIPDKCVSLRTVERQRKRAAVLAQMFENLRLKDINEDFLWKLHAGYTLGCRIYKELPQNEGLAVSKAFRKGVYRFLLNNKTRPWILEKYDWNWQQSPKLQNTNRTLKLLGNFLHKYREHPKAKDYVRFFRRNK